MSASLRGCFILHSHVMLMTMTTVAAVLQVKTLKRRLWGAQLVERLGSRTRPGSKSTICLLAMLLPRHQGALSTTLSRH